MAAQIGNRAWTILEASTLRKSESTIGMACFPRKRSLFQ
jgi:hypothetical protein